MTLRRRLRQQQTLWLLSPLCRAIERPPIFPPFGLHASLQIYALLPFLLLLFVGTVCGAMIVPLMGFFIVEGLGYPPWTISIYAGALSCLAIIINRQFAALIDGGESAFPLIGIALGGYLVATITLSVIPAFWTVLTFGVVGFGLSASAVLSMFSRRTRLAEQHEIRTKPAECLHARHHVHSLDGRAGGVLFSSPINSASLRCSGSVPHSPSSGWHFGGGWRHGMLRPTPKIKP